MEQADIINLEKYKDSKKRPILQDKKLLSFYYFLKNTLNIDLNTLHFQGYTRPLKQAHSIIFALMDKEEIDLKENAIFNFLDDIKSYCNNDLNPKTVYKADYILLNIIGELFDREYSKEELDNKDSKIIRNAILWSTNNEGIKEKLATFYYAYANTDLTICEKIASIREEGNNACNIIYNIGLLSYSFVSSLPKELYSKIISIIIKDPRTYSNLNEEFYHYAKEICEINPDFFVKEAAFIPFFLENTQDIIDVFGLNKFANMADEELIYISKYQKEDLIKIKQLIDLNVPICKISRLLCYPDIVRLGYQKVVLIKNLFSNKENSDQDKSLTKRK